MAESSKWENYYRGWNVTEPKPEPKVNQTAQAKTAQTSPSIATSQPNTGGK